MSIERQIKDIMSGTQNIMEADMSKRLDMLVRQGLMPASKLPILKRGLTKLNGGKALAPNERDAVNSLMNSFMFIVLGDDTVFTRAKMHTQKNHKMTEAVDEEDEFLTDDDVEQLFGEDDFVYDEDLAEVSLVHQVQEKLVSQMTSAEKAANDARRKEYNAFQKSKRTTPHNTSATQGKMMSPKGTMYESGEDFEPHYMYKDGKKEKAEKPEDHERLKKAGYTNSVVNEDGPITEAAYKLYHKSYTDAINTAHAHHAKSGLKVSDSDRDTHIAMGSKKPGSGKTTTLNVPATHTSGDSHTIHTQVYNKGGESPYELNTYSSKTPKKSGPKKTNEGFGATPPISGEEMRDKAQRVAKRMARKKSREEIDTDPGAKKAMKESYKDKFDAMLKKSGKTLADMSDEEKKEFFAKVDAGHDAKNEETQRGISFVDHALEEGVSTLSPEEESEAAPQLAEVVEEDDVQEDVKPFDKNARLHMIKTAARNVAKKSAAAAVRAAKSDYKQSSKRGLAPVKYDESFDYDSLTVESVEELSKTQAYRLIDAINKKINLGE